MRVSFFNRRLGLLAALAVCSACTPGGQKAGTGSGSDSIIDGVPASDFPESALIDILDDGGQVLGFCSGAVIAPRVVLTAGHCVDGVGQWRVTAPFAGNQTSLATVGVTDYVNLADTVNPDTLDVAVIVLDDAIELAEYPAVSSAPLADGTQLRLLGRIQEQGGTVTDTFFVTDTPVSVVDAAGVGFPLHYETVERIQPGDSGGPNIVESSLGGRHLIAGVNSGGGGGTAILARVELMFEKIQQIINDNGGGGGSGGGGAGGGSGGSGGGAGGGDGGAGGGDGGAGGGDGGAGGGDGGAGGGDGGPSCVDSCGGESPDGCFCDEQCAQFGDCCPDKAEVCDGAGGSGGSAGGGSGGSAGGGSGGSAGGDGGPSCAGSCGGESPDGCFCDEQCAQFGDCCPDLDAVCN